MTRTSVTRTSVTRTSVAQPGEAAVAQLLRNMAPQVLGVVARRYGDFADAEDAVQEALMAAAAQWPTAGLPDNPRGWLYQVAIRRLRDALRSEAARRRREDAVARERHGESAGPGHHDTTSASDRVDALASLQLAADGPFVPPADDALGVEQDDTLVLLFMCCHPALTPASAVALTLRAVGGLTTAEIGAAFLVPEATMAQRISRAKQSIKSSGMPFGMPTAKERTERLRAVLHVLYLTFSEGYASSSGAALQRTDLANEAIRLTRALHALLPSDGEVAGLLALMLLTDARRNARSGPNGELIPLDEQDRARWNRGQIDEGVALVSSALSQGSIGFYQLQAAIAAVHDEAPRVEDTDWQEILALYELLRQMSDNPMVTLNHAIAAAMVHGPAKGLELLQVLDTDPRMRGHYRLDAVRAHLFERAGDRESALAHYRVAADHTTSLPERNYLIAKATRLVARQDPADR